MPPIKPSAVRRLVVVLGDQLDAQSAAFDDFDPALDAVWMAEVASEATHVWSHKARIAVFLAAMRHFRDELLDRGYRVLYRQLDDEGNSCSFAAEIREAVRHHKPKRLVLVEPGEWRVREVFREAAREAKCELELRPDRHFLCTPEEFTEHAEGRKQLRMEFFYREMRRKTGVLVEEGGQPTGGDWNFDTANRGAFGRHGPVDLPLPPSFPPDATTRDVLRMVARHFPQHPGKLDAFDWSVTREQAVRALADFMQHRLARFGEYQDAMWTDEPFLYHSLLSSALNLKLLDPREVLAESERSYRTNKAPINAVEGFVRQILGWREYVRGVYWRFMPEYLERNQLEADLALPRFYWTADTEMHCLRQVISQTLEHGYAHHIQRLMVTGLFSLLLGVRPRAVHEWYLAVYVDAVEWVELPNTLGMSQYADGGVMASKPYIASGNYIDRMSNYCQACRYDPKKACGDDACPFTTFYWDFLARHGKRLRGNRRMTMQLRNLDRKAKDEMRSIRRRADDIRQELV
ncbi:MAG: cryptochrome/photolyase family protein [Planctomycetota bacterium]